MARLASDGLRSSDYHPRGSGGSYSLPFDEPAASLLSSNEVWESIYQQQTPEIRAALDHAAIKENYLSFLLSPENKRLSIIAEVLGLDAELPKPGFSEPLGVFPAVPKRPAAVRLKAPVPVAAVPEPPKSFVQRLLGWLRRK